MAYPGKPPGKHEPTPEDWGMPRMREPDFSDVRRHIFKPWKIALFIIISLIFWICFYWVFPGCGPDLPPQVEQKLEGFSGQNQKNAK
jgi:hypothetical protein